MKLKTKIFFYSYNEPQKLVQKEINKSNDSTKSNDFGLLHNYLSTMKSGTKVFQHFLLNSDLKNILEGMIHFFF